MKVNGKERKQFLRGFPAKTRAVVEQLCPDQFNHLYLIQKMINAGESADADPLEVYKTASRLGKLFGQALAAKGFIDPRDVDLSLSQATLEDIRHELSRRKSDDRAAPFIFAKTEEADDGGVMVESVINMPAGRSDSVAKSIEEAFNPGISEV